MSMLTHDKRPPSILKILKFFIDLLIMKSEFLNSIAMLIMDLLIIKSKVLNSMAMLIMVNCN